MEAVGTHYKATAMQPHHDGLWLCVGRGRRHEEREGKAVLCLVKECDPNVEVAARMTAGAILGLR